MTNGFDVLVAWVVFISVVLVSCAVIAVCLWHWRVRRVDRRVRRLHRDDVLAEADEVVGALLQEGWKDLAVRPRGEAATRRRPS